MVFCKIIHCNISLPVWKSGRAEQQWTKSILKKCKINHYMIGEMTILRRCIWHSAIARHLDPEWQVEVEASKGRKFMPYSFRPEAFSRRGRANTGSTPAPGSPSRVSQSATDSLTRFVQPKKGGKICHPVIDPNFLHQGRRPTSLRRHGHRAFRGCLFRRSPRKPGLALDQRCCTTLRHCEVLPDPYGLKLGGAERGEAVYDGDADLDFRCLSHGIS